MCCIYTYRWSYRKTFNKRPCVYLYNCLKPPAYIVTVTAFLWPPCVADAHIIFLPCSLLWPPYGIGQAIIFSSCCFLCLCSFFSTPNLSRRRSDVYYTSTQWCGLCANNDAGLKRAACGSLKIQDAKHRQKSPSGHHRTNLLGYFFATKACIDNQKKIVKQQYLLHMS